MVKVAGIIPEINYSITTNNISCDILEIRFDLFKDQSIPKTITYLKHLKKTIKLPLILTIRLEKEGGKHKKDESRLEFFSLLIPFCDFIDIEYNSKILPKAVKLANKSHKKVIISYHNFKHTPDNAFLLNLLKTSNKLTPALTKIAAFAKNNNDFLRLIAFTSQNSQNSPLCVIPMGHNSSLGRLICPLLGSALSYGYIHKPVVPGQLSIKNLKKHLH
ncbi:MAG: type I 3-dehydroquinate dehydratase [Elusimicrobia bacterium RIFOXYA2_FULL_39_19]|nr:MAG: type I 3-dehydroquinate dehydratase [Elusimicrobia bacterium RIFOXYA2_FULL_39_19]